jgi:tripartite-type tricarboxylate transporter receptor subunit TctC
MNKGDDMTKTSRHDAAGLSRRDLLGLAAAGLLPGFAAAAEDFPSRPIRLMLGTTPGGSIDYGARLVAQPLGDLLKTPVVVENKPGAAGVLCTEYVAKSPPDGYTLLLGTPSPIIIAPQAMPKVRVNPLTELIAINQISSSPLAIAVNPSTGVKSLKELVALSKKRPIRMALPLVGSLSHLVVEMVAKATGCEFLNVPYKGAAPAMTDAIGGIVDATVGDVGVFLQMHQEKRLRIALVTSEKRLPALPDVPTAHEDAPGLVMTNWLGVFAPANTPQPVIQKLNAGLVKVVASKNVKDGFDKASATATSMSSQEQFQKFVAAEYLRYGRLLRERNIVIE